MAELGVAEVHQGVADKAGALDALRERLGVAAGEVAMMGDDLPDLPAMARAGLALAPANAVAEVKRAAHWVARRPGRGRCGPGGGRDAPKGPPGLAAALAEGERRLLHLPRL